MREDEKKKKGILAETSWIRSHRPTSNKLSLADELLSRLSIALHHPTLPKTLVHYLPCRCMCHQWGSRQGHFRRSNGKSS